MKRPGRPSRPPRLTSRINKYSFLIGYWSPILPNLDQQKVSNEESNKDLIIEIFNQKVSMIWKL